MEVHFGSCILLDGLIREDRYLDTGALDDYYILFSCLDVGGARRGWCFNYFVTILIRHDPPTNFPWDKAIYDMKRFGIKARDFILTYVGDGKFYTVNAECFARALNKTLTKSAKSLCGLLM